MHSTMDIFKCVYGETLERKKQLSKVNNFKITTIPISKIQTRERLNLEKSVIEPIKGQSVIYLNEDVLEHDFIPTIASVNRYKFYELSEFISKTKAAFLVFDIDGLIDPNLIKISITSNNTVEISINKKITSFLSVVYINDISHYGRYNSNITINLSDDLINSYLVWKNGKIDWINYTGTKGNYKLPINAQGNVYVVIATPQFNVQKVKPSMNSKFAYINFPEQVEFSDLTNIFYWKIGDVRFSMPIEHTPLYDGFKIHNAIVSCLSLDGQSTYLPLGNFPMPNALSFEMKIRINEFKNNSALFCRGNDDSNGWILQTYTEGNDRGIEFQYGKYDSEKVIRVPNLSTGVWYTVAVVMKSDGSIPSIYVNSRIYEDNIISKNILNVTNTNAFIGKKEGTPNSFAKIDIAYIRIYDRAIDHDEVIENYLDRPTNENLTNYWVFDNDTGSVVNDLAGSLNLTVTGGSPNWKRIGDSDQGELNEDRVVVYTKRFESNIKKYSDIRHEYNKYRDYMQEYLNDTLPPLIKNFTPTDPEITEEMNTSDFQEKMVEVSKDFANYYKHHLENYTGINFTKHPVTSIRPIFSRPSQALNFNGEILEENVPRFLNNEKGILPQNFFAHKSAIYFDGQSTIRPVKMNSTEIGNEFTIMGWFNAFSYGAVSDIANRILTIFRTTSETLFSVGIYNDGNFSIMYYKNDGSARKVYITKIILNTFYHFAVSYKNGQFKIYLNGSLVYTDSGYYLLETRNAKEIRIGGYLESVEDMEKRAFHGLLSDIQIWAVEKSEEEIKDIVLNGIQGPTENLLAHWKCDEIGGNVLKDSSGNGHDSYKGADITTYYFNQFENGIVLEREVVNLNKDPFFANPIVDSSPHSSNWSIPYQNTVETIFSVDNGVLYHKGICNGNDSIRLNSPILTIRKTGTITVSFKIKYNKLDSPFGHRLFIYGDAVNESVNSQLDVNNYLYTRFLNKDGFEYREYRIPTDVLKGSGDTCVFGLWSDYNATEEIEYYIKEFSITQTDHGVLFNSVPKAADILKIPTANILSPLAGSIELWITINSVPTTENELYRILQANTGDMNHGLIIGINNEGKVYFSTSGLSSGYTTSYSYIKPNFLYHIAMTWENEVMNVFVNDNLVGSMSLGNAAIGDEIFIGSDPMGTNNLDCIVHEIRFSKIRRQDHTIQSNYHAEVKLPLDQYTTHKLSFNNSLRSPNELDHPSTLTTKFNLSNLPLFSNGLNIYPSKVVYNKTNKTYTHYFRENDVVGNDITVLDIGSKIEPYFEEVKVTNDTIYIGPSTKIDEDTTIRVFELPEKVQSAIYGEISTLSMDESGNIICFNKNSNNKRVIKLDYKTLNPIGIQSPQFHQSIDVILRSKDGHFYVAGRNNRIVKLDKDTLQIINESPLYDGPITLMVEESDGKLLVVGTDNKNTVVRRIDPSNYAVIATSSVYTGGINAIDIGDDGTVYIGGSSSINRVWALDKTTLQMVKQSPTYGGNIMSLKVGSNGTIYVGGSGSCKIMRLSSVDLSKLYESPNYTASFSSLTEGIDRYIYAGTSDGKIIKFDPINLTEIAKRQVIDDNVSLVFIDSFGYILAGGTGHQPITKYEPSTLHDVYDKKLELVDESLYNYTIDGNLIGITFDSSLVGKNVAVFINRYNSYISEGHSYDGLIQRLPRWVSFVPKENMFVFLNGRLLDKDRFYLFDPYRYKIVKGDTVISTDLDTDVINGEIFGALFTNQFEIVEYNVQLVDGMEIISLTNRKVPFSKKYNLVFVDGKLIYPSDIKEIDSYRFSLKANSTKNMVILRKKSNAESDKFAGIIDHWTQYLISLSVSELKTLLGELYKVQDIEDNTRDVYLEQRHLFEVLYHYCMKDRRSLSLEDNFNVFDEIPEVLLPDGRIPIATMRSGPYPRYNL